jgi:5-methylcytosine-specific restriction endonuclease McrA
MFKKTKRQKEYAKYLKTEHWKEIRLKVLERDNNQCLMCGTTKNINVHHKTYNNLGNEKLTDLVTICKRCHKLFHDTGYYHFIIPDNCEINGEIIKVDSETAKRIKHSLDIIRSY